jgi:hypothetical protein
LQLVDKLAHFGIRSSDDLLWACIGGSLGLRRGVQQPAGTA